MSLSDPLTLLREFTMAKRKIELDGEHIVFDKTRFMRSAKTAYRAGSAGTGEYYSIDAVWALLEKIDQGIATYTTFCGSNGIPVVGIVDRRTLLSYLRGEVSDSKNVDYSGYEAVQPVRLEAVAEIDAEPADEGAAEVDEAISKKAARREMTAEELEQLETARTAFLQLLEQPVGVPSLVEDDVVVDAAAASTVAADSSAAAPEGGTEGGAGDEDGGEAAAGVGGDKKGGEGAQGGESTSKPEKERLKEAIAAAKPFIRHDREKVSAITKREVLTTTRSTILLAPTMDKLPIVTQLLDGFVKRNKRVLEEKEKAARKQPRTSSSSASRPTAPSSSGARPSSSVAPPAARQSSSSGAAQLSRTPSLGAGATRPHGGGRPTAIIIVPAAITSIVCMLNVRDLLDKGEFTSAADRKARGEVKEASISTTHTFDDGSMVDLKVIDNPTKLSPAEWACVGACFAQGSTWQFKGWPFPNGEVEIFSKMAGFYVRFTDEIPNQKTKGWKVTNLVFSRERTRKHEVGVMMKNFWETLHQFLRVHKPQLLQHPKSR